MRHNLIIDLAHGITDAYGNDQFFLLLLCSPMTATEQLSPERIESYVCCLDSKWTETG